MLVLWGVYRLCALILTHLPRIVIALAVSVALHCLIGLATLSNPPPRLAFVLLMPGALVGWLFDHNFSGSAFLIGFLCSVVFYTVVAWLVLCALAYFRVTNRPIAH